MLIASLVNHRSAFIHRSIKFTSRNDATQCKTSENYFVLLYTHVRVFRNSVVRKYECLFYFMHDCEKYSFMFPMFPCVYLIVLFTKNYSFHFIPTDKWTNHGWTVMDAFNSNKFVHGEECRFFKCYIRTFHCGWYEIISTRDN